MLKFLKASFTPNITSKDPNTSLIIKSLRLFRCFLVNSCLASIVFFLNLGKSLLLIFLSNAFWLSCCRLRADSYCCSFSFSAKKSSWWFTGNSSCQKALCECDGAAARCFRQYDSQFQDRYKNYDRSSC